MGDTEYTVLRLSLVEGAHSIIWVMVNEYKLLAEVVLQLPSVTNNSWPSKWLIQYLVCIGVSGGLGQ